MSVVQTIYDTMVTQGRISRDPAQADAIAALDALAGKLSEAKEKKRGLSGLFSRDKAEPIPGLYIWGGVGRGKSMLMDLFYDEVPITAKRRVHFHAFMQHVQDALHAERQKGSDNAIRPVADDIASGIRLLCLDEMQVTDIADAMILGRLFERLFEQGVTIVTTSNRPPDDLYKDGLNRQLFLPFIALLKERLTVLELASDTDWRQNRLASSQTYFTPADATARAAIDAIWNDLTQGDAQPLTLRVKGREVRIAAFANGAARARFSDLCGQPLGPADYLALADAVRLLVLEDIPALSAENYNQARRFVTLIDALYEARVRLIASAAEVPDRLYLEGDGVFEFGRTASRLMEMQSDDWAG